MKILVDIIHPANIHYFKNFIFEMKKKNHNIIITSRDKDVTFDLLNAFKLDYINVGTGSIGRGAIGKVLYLIFSEFKFLKIILKNRPDFVLSFGSAPLAHICWLFRIPHVSFDDTEHAKLIKKLYVPFTPLILSPMSFYSDLGVNHIKFDAYMELFYLHKDKFLADKNILNIIGIDIDEPFTIFRFVSWGAFHDIGQKGLSLQEKIELVLEAKKYGKVFISSEGQLPDQLTKFQINIPAEKLHDVLNYASLYIGEGGTTASECAMLGTPSIYINSLPLMGYLKDCSKFNLLFHLDNMNEIITKMHFILNNDKNYFIKQRDEMLKSKINPTDLLLWLVEHYPESKRILMKDKNYQYKFK